MLNRLLSRIAVPYQHFSVSISCDKLLSIRRIAETCDSTSMGALVEEEEFAVQIIENLYFTGLVAYRNLMFYFVKTNGGKLPIVRRLKLLFQLVSFQVYICHFLVHINTCDILR